MNEFYYALSLLDTLFGLNMQEDAFEEVALTGWTYIGNKRTRLYRYTTCVENCERGIELPCNVDQVEAVTTNWEDWNYSTNDLPNGDIYSAFVESYIEHRKAFRDPLYFSGKLIKYERVGNMLYFDRPYGKINVLYRGLVVDDNGLPLITDKEAIALATYCAYILKFKEGIKTNNANIISFAQELKRQWLVRADLARVDQHLSQNEWNLVLDAKTCWDRKQYGKSFKLFK